MVGAARSRWLGIRSLFRGSSGRPGRTGPPWRGSRTYALILVGALALSGCASTETPDPAMTAAVRDAASAGRSARIGLEQSAQGRIFPPTLTTLLGDMADALADTARELVVTQPEGDANVEYRADALAATRAALEAVHDAEQGRAGARNDLDAALDDLAELAEQ